MAAIWFTLAKYMKKHLWEWDIFSKAADQVLQFY